MNYGEIIGHYRIASPLGYMSPEQARGDPLDARTDLFSFGIVLYEMATGLAPFKGSSFAVVLHEILGKEPVPPLQLNPELPEDLDRLIIKALEKDRELRCQSAAEILSDLKRLKRDRDVCRATSPGASVPEPLLSRKSQPAMATTASPSGDQVTTGTVKRHRTAFGVGILTLALFLVGMVYLATRRQPVPGAPPFRDIAQLTDSGKAKRPAISPEGNYVAYVQQDDEGESLWILQTETSSDQEVVPPQPGVELLATTVKPDGGFVDYIRIDRKTSPSIPSLWRVPFLSGTPKRLIDDVHGAVGWSPDGLQMAFVRSNPDGDSTELVIANADGQGERVVVTQQRPHRFMTVLAPRNPISRPAWSPDGRVIAVAGVDELPGLTGNIVFVNVASGSTEIVPLQGFASGLEWIDDSSLLISQPIVGSRPQLWRLSYPDGTSSRVTNDLANYDDVSFTSDRNSFVTGRTEWRGSIWMGDATGSSGSDSVQSITGFGIGSFGAMAWAGDSLIFTSAHPALFALRPGNTTPEEIIRMAIYPAATSDGRILVYISAESSSYGSLWKADADGRGAMKLTPGNNFWPRITPDDQSVIYVDGYLHLWSVPLTGGAAPTRLMDMLIRSPEISPDGRSLAFLELDEQKRFLTICALPRCTERQRVTTLEGSTIVLRWTPDGRSLAYAKVGSDLDIWVQPLSGLPPRQLTDFKNSTPILDFAWSRDGKRLAVARVTTSNDIVLFRGLTLKEQTTQ